MCLNANFVLGEVAVLSKLVSLDLYYKYMYKHYTKTIKLYFKVVLKLLTKDTEARFLIVCTLKYRIKTRNLLNRYIFYTKWYLRVK